MSCLSSRLRIILLAWVAIVGLLHAPRAWAQSPSPSPSASASPTPVDAKMAALLPTKPITHILLLDVSGSLRTRGYAARNADKTRGIWTEPYLTLLTHLMQPDETWFRSTDKFVVQSFSEAATEAREKQPVIGPLGLSDFVASEPQFPAPWGGATNMNHGLDLDAHVADLVKADSGAVITWLITDNENNWGGSSDDRGFYQRLRDDPNYSFVHFFPIADPDRPGDSLVMYMMVHNTGDDHQWVDGMVAATKARINADPILYRPLYSNPDASGLEVDKDISYRDANDDEGTNLLEQEGNTLVLKLQEGDSLDGELRLKIRSTLKGWRLTNAKLEGSSALRIPDGYKDLPATQTVVWKFSPSALTVDPEGETSVYRLTPDGSPLKFERSFEAWFSDMGAEWLSAVEGTFKMSATIDLKQNQIQSIMSDKEKARLHFVHDLDKIALYMSQQTDQQGAKSATTRTITMERPLEIRIHASGVGRLILMVAVGTLLVVLTLVALALFAWKSHYTVDGPPGQEVVTMSWLSGSHLLMEPSGSLLGHLVQRFGSLSFKPDAGVTINGESRPTRLSVGGSECHFELRREPAAPTQWTLSRADKPSAHDAASDGPVL